MKVTKFIKKIIYKYINIPVQVKAGMWFVASTVLLKGISFITVPIFTRLMTTEQYGIYSVYLTWCEIFTVLGTLSLESCAYISALTKFEDREKEEAQISLLELAFFVTSILLIVFLIGGKTISSLVGLPRDLLLLMIVQIYFVPSVNFWLMKSRFQYKYVGLVLVSVSMAVLNTLVGILFVVNLDTNYQALSRVISIVFVQAVYGVFLLYNLLKGTKIQASYKYWKWGLDLHLQLLPHTLSLKVLAGVDRIMINSMIGATAAALYSVSYSVAVVVNLIKNSIVDALRPWIYSKLEKRETENIKGIINGILLFASMIILIFVAFAPEVIWIVAPSNYYEAIYCMPPVMISSFFTFLYSVFSIVEMYFEETKKIMIASIGAALLNVALNYTFILNFGYIAAAFTTLVCYIFLAFAHYIMMKIILRKNNVELKLFDARMILILSIGLLCLMVVFEFLYSYTILRYLFMLVIIAVLIYKRYYFIGLIKILKNKESHKLQN